MNYNRQLLGLTVIRRRIIRYLIGIFTLPKVRDQIVRYAKGFKGEASRYSTGMKGEVVDAKDSFIILTKFIKREKITKGEKKLFKRQVADLLKSTGVVVPIMLIPLPFISTLILIIVEQLLLSMNIQILPGSFYPEKKQGLLTTEAVEEDLEKEVLKEHGEDESEAH
ncbi:MAG: LETM1 domain-containing protein [Bacteroidetes bacterium]|nr:LETM1 domain-containing protein [Bacteroidota bacterium]